MESQTTAGSLIDQRLQSEVLHMLGHIECLAGNYESGLEALQRSAAIARQVGFTWLEAGSLLGLAEFSLMADRVDACEQWTREGLLVSHQIGDRQWTIYGIAIAAWAAALRGDARKTGTLWGAIEAEESRAYHGAWASERHNYEAQVMKVAGPEFEEGRRQGHRFSLDEAVARAVGATNRSRRSPVPP